MEDNSSFNSDWPLLLKIVQTRAFLIQIVFPEYAQST